MIFQTIAVCALLLAPSPHHKYGLTEAMPRIDGTIRLCSYNVLNFFDHKDDLSLQGEYDDIGDNPGPTTLERCEELAKAIRAVDADILALQEVESEVALRWFNDTYLQGMGYEYVISKEVGYYRGVEQSVLSRFPISDVQTWPEEDLTKVKREGSNWTPAPPDAKELKFQRSPLCVTVEVSKSYSLTLFILHHKAGRNNNWHRESEALQTMEFVKQMTKDDPNRNIAVLGDFNAAPWDRSTRTYLRGGMIDTMSHRSTNIQYDSDAPLWKTHTSDRVIDFILLNQAAIGEFVPDSGFILGTSAQEYDWRNNPIPPGYASDHYPLAIDIVPKENMGTTVTASPWPTQNISQTTKIPIPDNTISAVGADFVASKRSTKVHEASCRNAKRIKDTNIVGYKSLQDALDAGKQPAGCCNPK
jgi:endonuclease/exonuclease/phosphatase family metal-dependent hydrolase